MTSLNSRSQPHPSRVLQVMGSVGLGGAEAMVMNVYRTLDHDRVQFDFLVFGDEEGAYESEIRSLGGHVIRMETPRRRSVLSFITEITHIIQRHGPFVAVHSHINFASSIVILAALRAGVPCRVAHAHIAGALTLNLTQRAYISASRVVLNKGATDIVSCGQRAGQYIFGRRWCRDGRVIPNAIQVGRFVDAKPDPLFRRQIGARKGTLLIGSIARLSPQKNHMFLLELVARLRAENVDAMLLLIGDGPLRSEIETEIEELSIRDHVRLLGLRRDIPEIMKSLDFLALPSLYEGLPVVLVEAQGAGLSCLVSDQVTNEIDLGLGLFNHLPLDVETWVAWLRRGRTAEPSFNLIRSALGERGYTAEESARALLDVYGLVP